VDVPQVGRQQRQPGLDVFTGSVGVEDGVDRERVAQIVRPGSTLSGAWRKAGVMDDQFEARWTLQ
jgi:hypothetical protein